MPMKMDMTGMTAKEKRFHMAKVFTETQMAMSKTVDDVALSKRAAVPFESRYTGGAQVSGPIPKDAHLQPSRDIILKPELPGFKIVDGVSLGASTERPWASYEKPTPSIFGESASDAVHRTVDAAAAPAVATATDTEAEDMWRAQYMEWTLQKNAYNPDIAAHMRTNVRKQAALSMVAAKSAQDPARTSENVRLALSHSEITGPSTTRAKGKLDLSNCFPN